jgi:hypothetical protein
LVTLLIVYGISFWRAELSVATMLLAGVAMSFLNSSLILILQYVSDPVRAFHAFRWMLGGLEGTVGYGDLKVLWPIVTIGCLIILGIRRELNLLALGDEWAISRGVSLLKTKALLLFVTGLMIASVVAICGPDWVCLFDCPPYHAIARRSGTRATHTGSSHPRRRLPCRLRHGGQDGPCSHGDPRWRNHVVAWRPLLSLVASQAATLLGMALLRSGSESAADLTGRFLRERNRRGTFIVPAQVEWVIHR